MKQLSIITAPEAFDQPDTPPKPPQPNPTSPTSTPGTQSHQATDPAPRRSNAREPAIEADIETALASLTIKQARFLIARLAFDSYGEAKCARLAGYADNSASQQASVIVKSPHVARLLEHHARFGRAPNDYGPTAIDRPAAMRILAVIAADNREPAKTRMDALKQLRDLEAWDKKGNPNTGDTDPLAEVLDIIDGGTAKLPSQCGR